MKVAIIGAGASGLTATKACLEEGLDPYCFEKSDAIGGLWRFREKDKFPDLACVFKSTIINSSKETMSFSDFPPPKEFPNYMHNSLVYKYLKIYAEKFDVLKHIQFNTSVVSVTKAVGSTEDSCWKGQWNVEVKNEMNGETQVILFDAVMVCVGHHAIPHIPDFKGLSEFQGIKLHTHEYRIPKQFEDKRVVVIGIGNSAGDAAVDLSRIASKFSFKVFLSTRRGAWVFPRAGEGGFPGDLHFNRAMTYFPKGLASSMMEKKLSEHLDHDLYGLRPKHSLLSAHPTVNDDLPNRIISGAVIIKPNIKCFSKTGVEFEDGTLEEDIDAVVLGTGYVFKFPFLSEDIVKVDQNRVSLYKYVFPPDIGASTLAIIGLAQPIGSTIPLAEMQSRWATRVFKGEVSLPNEEVMKKDIIFRKLVGGSIGVGGGIWALQNP
ncbi:Dimethylaniline monooxygenase [N-oxide-forming] 5 [Holothuria leucospilota]|uniref:Flavin-containing monooxygenase n=1 Tax=Holothuria leucospilota TaxID=206669 RepID=A0A9Q1C6R8_HOLLE|nr:Dimethylaniline monooxygenase [N-oxide-forming] 5 [Holothuria leucospilota]